MKKVIAHILIILYPLLGLANGFIIKGNIEGLETGTVSLEYRNEAGEDSTITTNIISGKFSFTGAVPEPELVRLTVTNGWSYSLNFFLENAGINIRLVKDAPEKTEITGSVSNTVYEKLNPHLREFFADARQNIDVHKQDASGQNRNLIGSADSIWAVQQKNWVQSIETTVKENPKNYAALYFIKWLLFKPDNFDAIQSLFMQLHPAVRNGLSGKEFLHDFEHLHKIALGQPAPEIVGKDTLGKQITLASLRGKVVLLDFWASYCGPCRNENRQMISVYEKYHPQGFEIISLSLDNERSLWVKAIEADKLNWPQASELRGGAGASAGVYDVSDLPRNFLIDRNGKIIAKDLFGKSLRTALDEFLGKKRH